jgi:hypothetical protein
MAQRLWRSKCDCRGAATFLIHSGGGHRGVSCSIDSTKTHAITLTRVLFLRCRRTNMK